MGNLSTTSRLSNALLLMRTVNAPVQSSIRSQATSLVKHHSAYNTILLQCRLFASSDLELCTLKQITQGGTHKCWHLSALAFLVLALLCSVPNVNRFQLAQLSVATSSWASQLLVISPYHGAPWVWHWPRSKLWSQMQEHARTISTVAPATNHNPPPGHVKITGTTETAQVQCSTARAVGYGHCSKWPAQSFSLVCIKPDEKFSCLYMQYQVF